MKHVCHQLRNILDIDHWCRKVWSYVWNASLLCCWQKMPSQSLVVFFCGSFRSFPYSWVSPMVKENRTSRKRPRNFPKSCSIWPMEICKALTKNLAHWTFIEVFTVVIYSSVLFLPIVDYFYIQATSALFLSQQSGKNPNIFWLH